MLNGAHNDGRRRAGNWLFGYGRSLAGPSVTRKCDKGVPRHGGAADAEAFRLCGVEDLVSALKPNGEAWARGTVPVTLAGVADTVQQYRSRNVRNGNSYPKIVGGLSWRMQTVRV
jgi:hypothetical protein